MNGFSKSAIVKCGIVNVSAPERIIPYAWKNMVPLFEIEG
jgi:hypothetical protein